MELRKTVATSVETRKIITQGAAPAFVLDAGAIFMADAIMVGRPSRAKGVHEGGEPVQTAEDDGSSSDIDPEEVRACL